VTLPTPGDLLSPLALQQRTKKFTGWRLVALLVGMLGLISAIRMFTGANDLTSSGTLSAAIGLAIPIGLAGLGGLWSERSGVVNIGLEGMMILGTWGAGWGGTVYGPWQGLLIGIAFGALGGFVHAIATVTFAVDQIVSGVAINLLGLGVTQYLSAVAFKGQITQSPQIPSLPTFTVPGVASLMSKIEQHHWFLVSDIAGLIRAVTFQMPWVTPLVFALLPITWFILWRTSFGLRLRSCGEAPYAAESLGVNVYRYKYIAVVVSGALAGLGGAFLATVEAGIYREGQTAGQGFIGLAAMIFGNWRPMGLAAGASLFGYTDAMQLRSTDAVHALLLVLAVLLILFAAWSFYRKQRGQAIAAAVIGAILGVWYFTTNDLPSQVPYMTPYLATLLVLSLASQRLRMPAADGIPYRRGQGK
jgi:ABC-type uncharacterized transport system permease subunit